MDMPPSRYKVVERGRRLIVIDRRNGAPVSGLPPEQKARFDELTRRVQLREPQRRLSSPPPPSPRPSAAIAPGDTSVFTTQAWFDDKAPRRVRLDEKNQTTFGVTMVAIIIALVFGLIWLGWLVLPVAAFLLLQSGVRKGIRKAITAWIDGMEQS